MKRVFKPFIFCLILVLILLLPLIAPAQTAAKPLTVTVTVSPKSIALDKGETVTATCTVTDGEPPYTYDFNKYAVLDGEDIVFEDTADEPSSITFRPRFGTQGYVTVTVEDASGNWATATSERYTITDDPAVQPLRLSAELEKETVDIATGESNTVICTVTGGEAPYTYEYHWLIYTEDDNAWSDDHIDSGNKSTLTPVYGTKADVYIEVRDVKGREAFFYTPQFEITGDPNAAEPLSLAIFPDRTSVDVTKNASLTIGCAVTGGIAPYFYNYNWSISDGGEYEFMPGFGGGDLKEGHFQITWGKSGKVYISVSDARDKTVGETFDFDILGDDAEPLSLIVELDKTSVDMSQNQSVTATLSPGGGTGPYRYLYMWRIGMQSNGGYMYPSKYGEETTDTSLSHQPTAAGESALWVMMFDGKDRIKSTEAEFIVNNGMLAPTPGDADANGTIDILDLVAIIDHIVSNTDPTSLTNADANGDDKVDILDLVWVIDRIVGG